LEPYIPERLPIKTLDYHRLIRFVGETNASLARYDGLLQGMVNPGILLSPLTTQEAVLSSRIEGTIATLDEVLELQAGATIEDESKRHDILEIVNYRTALMTAVDILYHQPITLNLLRQMHSVLMDSVRGKDKNPGDFRKNQNFIGHPGEPIENAIFVPPNPIILMDSLENWAKYIESKEIDILIQAAIVHAQFEIVHPFNDGNGRIGRLLIPLFLQQKQILSTPMFYVSAYFEKNREEYYARLLDVSKKKDWNGWIEFFLKALYVQANNNIHCVKSILKLYDEMKNKVTKATHSQYTIQILDALFERPIFQTTDFINRTKILKPTAMGLLRKLREEKILKVFQKGTGRKADILAFPTLLNIAEGKKII
jgi:Fic family protein